MTTADPMVCRQHGVVASNSGTCSRCEELATAASCRAFVRREQEAAALLWQRCASCGQRRGEHSSEAQLQRRAELVAKLDEPHAYVHRDAGDTSLRAAGKAALRSGGRRRQVLEAIVAAGDDGLTDEEGQLRHNIHPNTWTPRRLELQEAGYVEDSGDRRLTTYSGSPAVVWLPTLAGLDALERDA